MNRTRSFLVSVVLLGGLLPSLALAQLQPSPGIPMRPGRPYSPPSDDLKPLSANYLITVSVRADNKVVGQMSLLTASPQVQASAAIDSALTPISVTLSGKLAEKEGGLFAFDYSLALRVPFAMSSIQGGGNNEPPRPMNYQYMDHGSTGTVLMKLGKAYDLLEAGGRTYTVSIAKGKD